MGDIFSTVKGKAFNMKDSVDYADGSVVSKTLQGSILLSLLFLSMKCFNDDRQQILKRKPQLFQHQHQDRKVGRFFQTVHG